MSVFDSMATYTFSLKGALIFVFSAHYLLIFCLYFFLQDIEKLQVYFLCNYLYLNKRSSYLNIYLKNNNVQECLQEDPQPSVKTQYNVGMCACVSLCGG